MKNNLLGILKKPASVYPVPASGVPDEVISVEKKGLSRILEQNTTDLIFRIQLRPAPRLTNVTSSCLRVTGYTPEEFYADPQLLQKIVHPEDMELFKNFNDPVNAAKTAVLRWIRKDGAVIWTEHSKNVIYDEHGERLSVYFIVRDITRQKRLQEALKEDEDKIKTIFNNVNAVIVRVDKYGRIVESNCKVNDCFGFSRDEVVGKHFTKLGVFTLKEPPEAG